MLNWRLLVVLNKWKITIYIRFSLKYAISLFKQNIKSHDNGEQNVGAKGQSWFIESVEL